jgi:hypothetical protein
MVTSEPTVIRQNDHVVVNRVGSFCQNDHMVPERITNAAKRATALPK